MKIIAIGRNYQEHAKELNNPIPTEPVVFLKPDTALLKEGKAFYHPDFSNDIHYEVDMSLLGCNSKLLWHDIYQQIIDIISAKTDKSGIIVCKNFQDIHSELLDNFYSYMQKNSSPTIDLKFIIITEEISFFPDNILNCCEIINVSRPTKNAYVKCVKAKFPSKIKLENISIKNRNKKYFAPRTINELKKILKKNLIYIKQNPITSE